MDFHVILLTNISNIFSKKKHKDLPSFGPEKTIPFYTCLTTVAKKEF